MKTLPKYFVIKRDENDLELWQKYIDWLNERYESLFGGVTHNSYYGYIGNSICCSDLNGLQNIPTILTLEEWNECVNGEKEYLKQVKENIEKSAQEEIKKTFEYSPEISFGIKTYQQSVAEKCINELIKLSEVCSTIDVKHILTKYGYLKEDTAITKQMKEWYKNKKGKYPNGNDFWKGFFEELNLITNNK